MMRFPVLSAVLVGWLVLWIEACGGSGHKTGPEAGVGGAIGSGGFQATGGQSGQGGGGMPPDASDGGGAIGAGGASPPFGGSGGRDADTGADHAGTGGTPPLSGGSGGRDADTGADHAGNGGTGGIRDAGLDAGVDEEKDVPAPPLDVIPDLTVLGPCTGKSDFTPCAVVTAPDRKYDICVAGACVSPGCGDSTCNPPGPHFPLADTDERTCLGNSSSACPAPIACPAERAALYGQDAQYGWDTLHAESERFARSLTVAAEPVVEDLVTGLIWQGCLAGLGNSDCSGTATTLAWPDAVAYCDSLDWGGHQDWHLPDVYELDSIADAATTIDAAAFPSALQSGKFYWTSSTSAGRDSFAWGGSGQSFDKTYLELVRCVRGGASASANRFSRNATTADDPVVLDNTTKLIWQGCAAGLQGSDCATGAAASYSWADALAYCEGLSWAGQADWRLPNWKELRSIMDTRQHAPAIDALAFPATPMANSSLSSTPSSSSTAGPCLAWYVSFNDGLTSGNGPMITGGAVRCVRGGS